MGQSMYKMMSMIIMETVKTEAQIQTFLKDDS